LKSVTPPTVADDPHAVSRFAQTGRGVSDDDVTAVEISVPPHDAVVRAEAVRDWLLATGVIVPNPSPPSAHLPVSEAAARTTDIAPLWDTGVDVITERMVFDSGQNVTPPDCPNCAARLDIGRYIDQLEPWLLAGEPVVRCPACDRSWTGRANGHARSATLPCASTTGRR
jgi:hypothetical protein